MASIIKRPNGHYWIQITLPDRRRKTIKLGKVSKKNAEQFGRFAEELATARAMSGSPPQHVAQWLFSLSEPYLQKLARAELIDPVQFQKRSHLLGPFCDEYIEERSDVAERTRDWYRSARSSLVEYYGENQPLKAITEGDAEDWVRWMLSEGKKAATKDSAAQGLAPATASKRLKIAKMVFDYAVKCRLLAVNPFKKITASKQENRERDFFVTREATAAILDACPDLQWRCIVALARYGALRCPSEVLGLRLDDIKWDAGTMTVNSVKTKRYANKATRVVPLFPELQEVLLQRAEQADPGEQFVITRYRDKNSNLRTQFERIIKRAGLTSWPKLFQNLRASRETELANEYPIHVVVAWVGNSVPVAMGHYLQVTDDHIAKATGKVTQPTQPKKRPAGKR